MRKYRLFPSTLGISVAILVTCAEAELTWQLTQHTLPLPWFFLGHIGILGLIITWLFWLDKKRYDITHPAMLGLLTCVLGIFGAALCLCYYLLSLVYSKYATPFKEWYALLFPENHYTASNLLYERLLLGKDDFSEKDEVVPFMDVMTLGTEQQKRKALEKIVRHFSPEFAPALLQATDDPSPTIRVQAASILATLEGSFSSTMHRLEKRLEIMPNHTQTLFQLAKHYDLYAHTGFLNDPQHQEALREKAIETYGKYLNLCPHDQDAKLYLATLYIRMGHIETAYRLLKPALLEKTVSSRLIWRLMECLFHLRRFKELKTLARHFFPQLDPENPDSFALLEMVKLWGGGIGNNNEVFSDEA